MRMNHLICNCDIIYDNGATVKTSFVTSYGGDTIAQTCPELSRRVNETVQRLARETKAQLPKYEYPDNIVTAAIMQRWAGYGVEFAVRRQDCTPIYSLDAQRGAKKEIYGGGLLLSERAAAERAAAERAAATVWELSERERQMVRALG
jgi:hypothetical protein